VTNEWFVPPPVSGPTPSTLPRCSPGIPSTEETGEAADHDGEMSDFFSRGPGQPNRPEM
jgi:hypothetical protein